MPAMNALRLRLLLRLLLLLLLQWQLLPLPLLPLLLLRMSSLRRRRRPAVRHARPVVARARCDLRAVRVIARVIRVRLGTARCARGRGRGEPRAPGQLPQLRRGERAAPLAAVVPCRPESAPAPHALRFLHAVAQVVVMVMVAHCGRGGVAGG